MFFFFETKNSDPMKIKKFYYYSPEKLKLVPIKHFIPKAIFSLSLFGFFIFLISLFFVNIFSPNSEVILKKQTAIANKELTKELETLKNKYKLLGKKFEKISKETNSLRLAVNLLPLDNIEGKVGIGGNEFNGKISYEKEDRKFGSVYKLVNNIETSIKLEKANYEEILNKFEENKKIYDILPAIKPVNAPIGDRFGMRFHPILKRRRMHHGLDFLANIGTEVVSPSDGIVTYVGRKGGYGKVVRISHGFGYETLYAHLSKYKVKKGQKVKRGQLIALTGNSGNLSTGPHLHYEVRHNGVSLNPRNFIFEDIRLFDNQNRVASIN